MMRRQLYLFVVFLFSLNFLNAQYDLTAQVGKGIQLKARDGSFYLKFRTRIQPRWDFEYIPKDSVFTNKAFVSRARLKFDGYFINENLRYKIEYDVVGGYVRDALIKFRMGHFDLWFGQGKLPGNRERVVSSGDLQLVNRSIYNSHFTLDRDIGIQLHNFFYIGKVLIRDIIAVSGGSGILDNEFNDGYSVTGKIEVLPFGKFTKKGDYFFSDLLREPKPKLSISAYANFNKNAYKDRGQIGKHLGSSADLFLYGGDLFLKYRGYSFMLEAGSRLVTSGPELVYDNAGVLVGTYYTGWGMNIQTGYLLKSNWEFVVRYANAMPASNVINPSVQDHTIGINKFIIGHNFKIQTDFTWRRILNAPDIYIGRLQVEFQF